MEQSSIRKVYCNKNLYRKEKKKRFLDQKNIEKEKGY